MIKAYVYTLFAAKDDGARLTAKCTSILLQAENAVIAYAMALSYMAEEYPIEEYNRREAKKAYEFEVVGDYTYKLINRG
jgi:hypothetical protein